jgi:hypothetical protein
MMGIMPRKNMGAIKKSLETLLSARNIGITNVIDTMIDNQSQLIKEEMTNIQTKKDWIIKATSNTLVARDKEEAILVKVTIAVIVRTRAIINLDKEIAGTGMIGKEESNRDQNIMTKAVSRG